MLLAKVQYMRVSGVGEPCVMIYWALNYDMAFRAYPRTAEGTPALLSLKKTQGAADTVLTAELA